MTKPLPRARLWVVGGALVAALIAAGCGSSQPTKHAKAASTTPTTATQATPAPKPKPKPNRSRSPSTTRRPRPRRQRRRRPLPRPHRRRRPRRRPHRRSPQPRRLRRSRPASRRTAAAMATPTTAAGRTTAMATSRSPRRRAVWLAALGGLLVLAGCGAAQRPTAFAWLHPRPPPAGRRGPAPRECGHARLPARGGTRSTPTRERHRWRSRAHGARSSGTPMPRPGRELKRSPIGPAFGTAHIREEGSRHVRTGAAATGLRVRSGHGSCVMDDYHQRRDQVPRGRLPRAGCPGDHRHRRRSAR